jgi:hypothetical protein
MDVQQNVDDIKIEDPFASQVMSKGIDASWVVRDLTQGGAVVTKGMDHYDAARETLLEDRHADTRAGRSIEVLSREDQIGDILVHGFGHDSRWMTEPTAIDITPALQNLEMQDFVDILNGDFEDSPGTRKVLDILEEQGDPRAGRLRMYEKEWSTPDDAGNRAEACLDIDKDSLMAWVEENRPEIHDEMKMRMESTGPSMY